MTSGTSSSTFHIFTSLRFDRLLILDSLPLRAGWNYYNPSSPFYMLDLHRDRLLRAATHFSWPAAIDLLQGQAGLDALAAAAELFLSQDAQNIPLRVRIAISESGKIEFQKSSTPNAVLKTLFPARLPLPGEPAKDGDPAQNRPYMVIPDYRHVAPSEYTHYKTTVRDMYDSARERASIGQSDMKEVLVLSDTGQVMEGSVTTPYFWRGGRWVTPPVSRNFASPDGGDSGGQDGTTRRWALERKLADEEVVSANSLTNGEPCWLSNGVKGFFYGLVFLADEGGPRKSVHGH